MKKSISLLLSAIMLLSVLMIAPVTANAGGVIEIPVIDDTPSAPGNSNLYTDDGKKIFDVLSPTESGAYTTGKPIDLKMIAYLLPENAVTNKPNTMYAEIAFNGVTVKNYIFTVNEADLNTVYTDKFVPEAIGTYSLRASYGGGVYSTLEGGRHFISFDFKVSADNATVSGAKKSNPIIVKAKSKTVKAKSLKKKNQKVKVLAIKNPKGKLSYKIVKKGTTKSIYKYLKINSKGTVVIKKCKLKKGTYKVKIKVKAAGTKEYFSGGATVTAKIKIK